MLKERKRSLENNREQLMLTLGSVGERSEGRQRELAELEHKLQQSRQALEELRAQLADEEARLEGVAGGISQSKEEKLKSALLELMNLMAHTATKFVTRISRRKPWSGG